MPRGRPSRIRNCHLRGEQPRVPGNERCPTNDGQRLFWISAVQEVPGRGSHDKSTVRCERKRDVYRPEGLKPLPQDGVLACEIDVSDRVSRPVSDVTSELADPHVPPGVINVDWSGG